MTPEAREIVVQRLTAEMTEPGHSDRTVKVWVHSMLDALEACGYQIIEPAEAAVNAAARKWLDVSLNPPFPGAEFAAEDELAEAVRAADCKETDQ